MSVTDQDKTEGTAATDGATGQDGSALIAARSTQAAGILGWMEGEAERLHILLPKLEAAAMNLTEELADADVIRRHVILHPDRFSPIERDVAVEKAHELGERRQRAEVMAQAVREQLQLCEAVAAGVRALGRVEGAGPAGTGGSGTDQGSERAAAQPPASVTLAIFQAVEAERLRIARTLHDGPARILADLVLKAEILDRMARRTPDALPAELDDFKLQVRTAVADMRRFMFNLRPDSLDELGLIPTMKRLAEEFQDGSGISCELQISGEELPIGPELSDALFRILQEALANVRSHSQAATVTVTLAVEPARVSLAVRDDGKGFSPDDRPPVVRGRLGIIGMRERAHAVGGSLELTSQPGQGTQIRGEFPVRS